MINRNQSQLIALEQRNELKHTTERIKRVRKLNAQRMTLSGRVHNEAADNPPQERAYFVTA